MSQKSGQTNRLDLEMKVATASERLSSSSGYAGYSLGGIDRAVRIYALPKTPCFQSAPERRTG